VSSSLTVESITKRHGATTVLKGVSLDVDAGEFITLVGPSGCGKTTLLRIIAGLAAQDGGRVSVAGQTVDHLPPKARGVAMVFQSYALYPHMTVMENISTPLTHHRLLPLARLPGIGRLLPGTAQVRRGIRQDVERVARQVELSDLLDRKPGQLSGGQRQRVALARAMVRDPSVFLMDEPLSNLDARLRVHMRGELSDLHRRLGATFLYVTHDQVEAMTMSNRVAVMMDGEVIQLASPGALYDDPADLRVARFIGSPEINTFAATLAADHRPLLDGRPLDLAVGGQAGDRVTIAVRPERLALAPPGGDLSPGGLRLEATLHRVENLGHEVQATFDRPDGAGDVVLRMDSAQWRARLGRGEGPLVLTAAADDLLVFDAAGRRLRSADRSMARAS
jgi:multiple sugar transport system ATP-binding protein